MSYDSYFFYWREELVLVDLLSTLNIVVKCVENLLQPFEKKFQPKKGVSSGSPNPFWDPIFVKNQDILSFPGI